MSKFAYAIGLLGLLGCGGSGGGAGGDGGDVPPAFTNGVSTLAGTAEADDVDGTRGEARFANPVNVAYGPDGLLYVADFDNHKIRAVEPSTGDTYTVVEQAGFKKPFALLWAGSTLYVSTDDSPTGAHSDTTGTIWRVNVDAGTATPIAERIGRPRGMAMLPDGRLAVSDYMHHVIQTVDVATGQVTPLAGAWDDAGMVDGGGGGARFSTPYGMVLRDNALLVADYDNGRIRQVALDGTTTTLTGSSAGFADGDMGVAQFSQPQGVAVATDGSVFVSDLGNYRVRRLVGTTVDTIAGSGEAGYADSDDRLAAQLYGLEGLAVTPDGAMVYVADGGRGERVPYNRIRSVKMQ